MSDGDVPVELIAYSAPANPPMIIALAIVLAALTAPFLFLRANAPSPLLGLASLALGLASIFALSGAVNGQRRLKADPGCRTRAQISSEGIILFKTASRSTAMFFPAHQIAKVHLLPSALIIQTTEAHPQPGRHAVRFGKLVSHSGAILKAVEAFEQKSGESV